MAQSGNGRPLSPPARGALRYLTPTAGAADRGSVGSHLRVGVLWRVLVTLRAMRLPTVLVGGRVFAGLGVLLGRYQRQVGRIDAPAVHASWATATRLRAVVAVVVHLSVIRLLLGARQMDAMVTLVCPAVRKHAAPRAVRPGAHVALAVAHLGDVGGPVPAAVAGFADMGHEAGIKHVADRSRSARGWLESLG